MYFAHDYLRRIKLEQMLGQRASQNQLAVIFNPLHSWCGSLLFLVSMEKMRILPLGAAFSQFFTFFLASLGLQVSDFHPGGCPLKCVTELKGVKI